MSAAQNAGEADSPGRISRGAGLSLFLFALALRLPTLALHRLVEGDGVHYAQLARAILAGDFSGLANPYWSNLWPAVIAATSWLTRLDVVGAGRVASLIAGSFLAVVVAQLAARCFGSATGVAVGLLVAGHPWLIHFSTLVFSESFFSLLLFALLLATARATGDTASAVMAGVLAGLAVVTRPEAYSSGTVALAWIIVSGWSRTKSKALLRGLLLVGLASVFVFGRACLVHHYFEMWDFGVSVKGAANLLVGLAETDRDEERLRTEVAASGENLLSQRASEMTLVGFAWAHPGVVVRHMCSNALLLAGCTARVFPQIPLVGGRPPILSGDWSPALVTLAFSVCGLALLGAIVAMRDPRSRQGALVLTAVGALYLLGLAPLTVHDRLVVPLVPLFLMFLASGIVGITRRLWPGDTCARPRVLGATLALAGIACLAFLLNAPVLDYAGDPPIQRETGEWLAARYPRTTRIMSAAVVVGFYFYDAPHADNELSLPWADVTGVVQLARSQGVTLIVAPEWHLRAVDHPAASALLDPATRFPGLVHVATLGDEARGRIFVWHVRTIEEERATAP